MFIVREINGESCISMLDTEILLKLQSMTHSAFSICQVVRKLKMAFFQILKKCFYRNTFMNQREEIWEYFCIEKEGEKMEMMSIIIWRPLESINNFPFEDGNFLFITSISCLNFVQKNYFFVSKFTAVHWGTNYNMKTEPKSCKIVTLCRKNCFIFSSPFSLSSFTKVEPIWPVLWAKCAAIYLQAPCLQDTFNNVMWTCEATLFNGLEKRTKSFRSSLDFLPLRKVNNEKVKEENSKNSGVWCTTVHIVHVYGAIMDPSRK